MNRADCPVCKNGLVVELKEKERNGRFYLMLVCPVDGAHFRAFINDRDYVAGVMVDLKKARS